MLPICYFGIRVMLVGQGSSRLIGFRGQRVVKSYLIFQLVQQTLKSRFDKEKVIRSFKDLGKR